MLHKQIKQRIIILFICCSILFIAIFIKLVYEQIVHQDVTLDKAYNLWQREFHLPSKRGMILDCHGEVLAHDLASTSLVVVPSQIKDKKACAKKLVPILKCDYDWLYNVLTKKVSTQKVLNEGRFLSSEQVRLIENLNEKGLYLIPDVIRNYPLNEQLSQVLGFCGSDNQGLAGLELVYDNLLLGKKGSLNIVFDAKGNEIERFNQQFKTSGCGMNLKLSIDAYIQGVLERELSQAYHRYNCASAYALAMNPNNGQVLGMVSIPNFNPNHYQDYPSNIINQNLPIWKSFEPGSTFKSIIFAWGLENNLFDMYQDQYFDKGYELVNGVRIKSWKLGGHGQQTFLQVLENSSNPGFVEISRRMGIDLLFEGLNKFGFMQKSNIDLPGEAKGIMFNKDAMSELELACVCFGQGISVTSIQLARAFSALVNGGYLYEPSIVSEILEPYTNEVIYKHQPKLINQVISKETSEKMKYALESVVANGGGKAAYLQGYRIGGKTGTAQLVENGKYADNQYILSFISAAPLDNAKIVLYIALDRPHNDILYGGTLVAPIAKSIYEDVLPYLGVKPSEEQMPLKKVWPQSEYIVVNDFINLKKKDVKQEGVKFVFIGEGDYVIDQLPKAKTQLDSESGEVWIYLGEKVE